MAHAKRGLAGLARLVRAGLAIGLGAGLLAAAACAAEAPADTLDLKWTLRPERPVVGPATLTLRLGAPHAAATGTRVRVVGHMTHPGMQPVEATTTRRGDGTYEANFAFTMAGDWALLVTIELANGRRVERRLDVPGVREAPAGSPAGRAPGTGSPGA